MLEKTLSKRLFKSYLLFWFPSNGKWSYTQSLAHFGLGSVTWLGCRGHYHWGIFWYLTIIWIYLLFLLLASQENFNASFMETLQCVKVDLLSQHLGVEEAVNIFNSVCTETLDCVVPLRQVCGKNKSAPWYNVKSLRKHSRRWNRR